MHFYSNISGTVGMDGENDWGFDTILEKSKILLNNKEYCRFKKQKLGF